MDISKLQPKPWDYIQSIITKDRIGNAYLIHGPSGSGKEAFALEFCSLITGFKLNQFINYLKALKWMKKNIKNGIIIGRQN